MGRKSVIHGGVASEKVDVRMHWWTAFGRPSQIHPSLGRSRPATVLDSGVIIGLGFIIGISFRLVSVGGHRPPYSNTHQV